MKLPIIQSYILNTKPSVGFIFHFYLDHEVQYRNIGNKGRETFFQV